jgi:geranylgeranyl reductase family protein
MDADVVVVGGSVAGSATAIHLARGGASVIVLDRASFPREKVCGEGLMPHGVAELARLGLGDQLAAFSQPFYGIAYHAGGATAIGRFPHGEGLGVRRLGLDRLLSEAARSEGVDVRSGVRVDAVRADAAAAVIETSEGTLRARALVGADGLRSDVRARLGLAGRSDEPPRYGARFHVRLPESRPDRDVVDVYVTPRCELYLTPTGRAEANVAVLCGKSTSQTFGGDLLAGLRRLVDDHEPVRDHLAGYEVISEAKLTGPLRQPTTGVVADRAVLVGDAAGFVDAITGEGMSISLVSARMAAGVLLDGLRRDRLSAADLRPYQDQRAAFARDLFRMSELVVWWLQKPALARWVVGNLGRHPDTFSRMLGVNCGDYAMSDIGPRDWARIAFGI